MVRAPGVFLPPLDAQLSGIFFFRSLTLSVKVVALANRRESIAWRLQLFRRYFQKSVQYAQPLTVRPHLYMNAAAPLYNAHLGGSFSRQHSESSQDQNDSDTNHHIPLLPAEAPGLASCIVFFVLPIQERKKNRLETTFAAPQNRQHNTKREPNAPAPAHFAIP